jgi:hypothetical protein
LVLYPVLVLLFLELLLFHPKKLLFLKEHALLL